MATDNKDKLKNKVHKADQEPQPSPVVTKIKPVKVDNPNHLEDFNTLLSRAASSQTSDQT